MFVHRARAQCGPDVVAHEFFAKVFDGGAGGARGERFFVGRLQVFLLSYVADHGDYFAVVVFFQPRDDDGSVQASGVCQHDLFWFMELLVHKASLFFPSSMIVWATRHPTDIMRVMRRLPQGRRIAPTRCLALRLNQTPALETKRLPLRSQIAMLRRRPVIRRIGVSDLSRRCSTV